MVSILAQSTTSGTTNLLGSSGFGSSGVLGGLDLLSVARAIKRDNGVGLSGNSRARITQFLNSTSDGYNSLLSLGVGAGTTIEGLQQQILALRSSLPENQVAPSLRGKTFDSTA